MAVLGDPPQDLNELALVLVEAFWAPTFVVGLPVGFL